MFPDGNEPNGFNDDFSRMSLAPPNKRVRFDDVSIEPPPTKIASMSAFEAQFANLSTNVADSTPKRKTARKPLRDTPIEPLPEIEGAASEAEEQLQVNRLQFLFDTEHIVNREPLLPKNIMKKICDSSNVKLPPVGNGAKSTGDQACRAIMLYDPNRSVIQRIIGSNQIQSNQSNHEQNTCEVKDEDQMEL